MALKSTHGNNSENFPPSGEASDLTTANLDADYTPVELFSDGIAIGANNRLQVDIIDGSTVFQEPRDTVEFATISASTASSSVAFSTLTASSVRDVVIINESGNDCYINFGSGSVGAASSSNHLLFSDGGSISINDCSFTHFSATTTSGTTTIKVTGIGVS